MSGDGGSAYQASLLAALPEVMPGAVVSTSFGRVSVDVAPTDWQESVRVARDELGFAYFDWLSAVDELDEGMRVITHLWQPTQRTGLLLRARLATTDLRLDTITGVFRGAAWHERETYEMFGIAFVGHDNLRPLLLPPGFEGNPLRKDFVLAARVAKAWPGAKEPGESEHEGASARRRMQPPGIPDPATWRPHDVEETP
jgi:NADH-quinone oxidoreductase subunit C